MDTTQLIRKLIIAEIAIILLYIIVSFVLTTYFEELLIECDIYLEEDFTLFDLALLLLLVAYIVAVVGFFNSLAWAGNLYFSLAVVGLLLTPFTGPTIEHALTGTILDIGSILSGIIIALLIFTPSVFKSKELDDLYATIQAKFSGENS